MVNQASLAAVCMRWMAAEKYKWSIGTQKIYGQRVSRFCKWLGGRTITDKAVKQFIDDYITKGHSHNGLDGILTTFRMFFNWAIEKNIFDYNPFAEAKNPIPRPPFRKDVFTRTEYAKMKEASAGTMLYALVVLGYNCGFRSSDIFELNWKDIDYDNQIIRRKPRKTQRLGTQCRVPFASGTDHAELLFALKASAKSTEPDGFVFPFYNTAEAESRKEKCKKQFVLLMKRLNIRGRSLHSFRRTFLTNLASSGCDTIIAMHMSGISNVNTLKHYIVPSAEAMRQAMDRAKTFSELL